MYLRLEEIFNTFWCIRYFFYFKRVKILRGLKSARTIRRNEGRKCALFVRGKGRGEGGGVGGGGGGVDRRMKRRTKSSVLIAIQILNYDSSFRDRKGDFFFFFFKRRWLLNELVNRIHGFRVVIHYSLFDDCPRFLTSVLLTAKGCGLIDAGVEFRSRVEEKWKKKKRVISI